MRVYLLAADGAYAYRPIINIFFYYFYSPIGRAKPSSALIDSASAQTLPVANRTVIDRSARSTLNVKWDR